MKYEYNFYRKRLEYYFFSLYILSIGFLDLSCTKSITSSKLTEGAFQNISVDSILFISLKIVKNNSLSNGQEVFLVKKQKVKGNLKVPFQKPIFNENSQLIVSFFDKDNQIINREFIENPLNELIEFVNDKGQFERKKIEKPESDIIIRVNNNPNIHHITIAKNEKEIISTILIGN